MGNYTKNLFKKNRNRLSTPTANSPDAVQVTYDKSDGVKLTACGIIRDGVVHTDRRSHSEIRKRLGDENPYTSNYNDTEGFITSEGNFVTRRVASHIAYESGQCRRLTGNLLSSDIDHW